MRARDNAKDERQRLKAYRKDHATSLEAQSIIQEIAATIQTKAHAQITRVVTKCLQSVFGKRYKFRINFVRKRGKTEAVLKFVKKGIEIDPTTGEGGGVVDLAALALRISCLVLATPKRRKFVALDEPLRNVHGEQYREQTAKVLMMLAKELEVQIVMVTGMDWLKIGKVINIGD